MARGRGEYARRGQLRRAVRARGAVRPRWHAARHRRRHQRRFEPRARRAGAARARPRLGPSRPIRAVGGGDSVAHRKPHAEGLLRACEELRVGPREALMVGDSLTDVLAARAAGLSVICVPYGYNEGADPRSLPCDAFVESVADLPPLLIASGIVALA